MKHLSLNYAHFDGAGYVEAPTHYQYALEADRLGKLRCFEMEARLRSLLRRLTWVPVRADSSGAHLPAPAKGSATPAAGIRPSAALSGAGEQPTAASPASVGRGG